MSELARPICSPYLASRAVHLPSSDQALTAKPFGDSVAMGVKDLIWDEPHHPAQAWPTWAMWKIVLQLSRQILLNRFSGNFFIRDGMSLTGHVDLECTRLASPPWVLFNSFSPTSFHAPCLTGFVFVHSPICGVCFLPIWGTSKVTSVYLIPVSFLFWVHLSLVSSHSLESRLLASLPSYYCFIFVFILCPVMAPNNTPYATQRDSQKSWWFCSRSRSWR